jgi:cold shock CspA family protein
MRFTGVVRFYHRGGKYGFVRREDGQDFYIPASAVALAGLTLKVGDTIEFSEIPPGGLPRAAEISLITRGR